MREKVSELIGLVGNAPFNIVCSPYETHICNTSGKSQKNLIDLRLKISFIINVSIYTAFCFLS